MLTSVDLERLIGAKKTEILEEKIKLGLSEAPNPYTDKENKQIPGDQSRRRVAPNTQELRAGKAASYDNALCERRQQSEKNDKKIGEENKVEPIPAELERYIRRYLGLPAMLKTGEYSPNNPLFREAMRCGEGDALLAIGQYERGRHAARQRAQREHREFLEQQARQKHEQKEKEKREREAKDRRDAERERQLQERDRALELEREKRIAGATQSRALLRDADTDRRALEREREVGRRPSDRDRVTTVDTAVQVDASERTLSVGVQTDRAEFLDLSPMRVTRAERELSPRRVRDREERFPSTHQEAPSEVSPAPASCRSRLLSELRHTGLPAVDADVRARNTRCEQEAAEKKLTYQQELRNQIQEQQRIREEGKERERLLELAETRRLERQLGSLRAERDAEGRRHGIINTALSPMRVTRAETELSPRRVRDREERFPSTHQEAPSEVSPAPASCRSRLLSELRHTRLPAVDADVRARNTRCEQEAAEKKLTYQQELRNQIQEQQRIREERKERERLLELAETRRLERQLGSLRAERDAEGRRHGIINTAFKANATDFEKKRTALQKEIQTERDILRSMSQPTGLSTFDSKPIRSRTFTADLETPLLPNYDVDEYLRRNLNPSRESLLSNGLDTLMGLSDERRLSFAPDHTVVVEKALIHEPPTETRRYQPVPAKRNNFDTLPVPALRHSPKPIEENASNLSDSMKRVDAKWEVPAVQKSIVKMAGGDSAGFSILTQLGSIRRQLQMEQMRLDKMVAKE